MRAEEEGRWALPDHEFGLDIVALIGVLSYHEHRSVPAMHAALRARGVPISERSATNLLDRYDELLALRLTDSARLREVVRAQGRVVLAIDGLHPDVGHEALWVVRDCLSSEVLAARSLLASGEEDLAPLLKQVQAARRPGGWRRLRRPALHPQRCCLGPSRCAAPVVPLPLPARGRPAFVRGG